MKNLKKYLNENISFNNELEEISGWLGTLDNLSELLDKLENSKILGGNRRNPYDNDNIDDHTKRYVMMIIQRLMNDPEIKGWYDSPYNNEVELMSLLSKKLSPREANYMQDVAELLSMMTDNDNDAEIVNNAIMRLIDDPDVEKWFNKTVKQLNSTTKDEYGRTASNKEMLIHEFALRKLINSKLNAKEKRFSEPIVRKFIRILNNEYESDDYFKARGENGLGRDNNRRRR